MDALPALKFDNFNKSKCQEVVHYSLILFVIAVKFGHLINNFQILMF